MSAGTSGGRLGGRFTIALAILALALVAGGSASAGAAPVAGTSAVVVIHIKGNSLKTLRFVGPKTMREGQLLEVVNETDSKKVGPQTFSLVEPEEIPKTKKQQEKCSICKSIMGWHGIKHGGKPAQVQVMTGLEGWDTSGTTSRKGDSWYTNKKGQSIQEPIVAGATAAPETLAFMSAFDPALHGSIKVAPLSE